MKIKVFISNLVIGKQFMIALLQLAKANQKLVFLIGRKNKIFRLQFA